VAFGQLNRATVQGPSFRRIVDEVRFSLVENGVVPMTRAEIV